MGYEHTWEPYPGLDANDIKWVVDGVECNLIDAQITFNERGEAILIKTFHPVES